MRSGLDSWNPADSAGDADEDGASNLQEYRAGTDANVTDSDGDWQLDGFELNQAGSDPLTADFDGSRTVQETLSGTNTVSQTGSWSDYGDTLFSTQWGGSLNYNLPVATSGYYAVEIDLTQFDPAASRNDFHLTLHANGLSLGKTITQAAFGETDTATWMLPYQTAGNVDIQMDWHYEVGNGSMRVLEVRLVSLGGPDGDQNGVADWLDYRNENALAVQAPPQESYVSPVCVEGNQKVPGLPTIASSYMPSTNPVAIVVQQAVGKNWFADIPLSPTNVTDILTTDSDEGVVHSNEVTWAVLNLLEEPSGSLTIRKNDSLLLNAFPIAATNGTVDLVIVGVTNYTTSIDAPIEHLFDTAGTYTIDATWTGGSVISTQFVVEVVSAQFAGDPLVWPGRVRTWDCSDIPDTAYIESDSHMSLSASPLETGGTTFDLTLNEVADYRILARLGEDQPILDVATIQGIDMVTTGLDLTELHEWDDGTLLVRMTIKVSEVSDDLALRLYTFTGNVFFADGSTELYLRKDHFDGLGEAVVYFVVMPDKIGGICHRMEMYQGEDLVGQR